MKRSSDVALLIVLAGIVLSLGCASERAQLATATDAYATTLQVLADARQAGLVDDAAAAEIETWRATARDALDAWRVALEAGEQTDGPVQRFNQAMRSLTQALMAAQRRPPGEAD